MIKNIFERRILPSGLAFALTVFTYQFSAIAQTVEPYGVSSANFSKDEKTLTSTGDQLQNKTNEQSDDESFDEYFDNLFPDENRLRETGMIWVHGPLVQNHQDAEIQMLLFWGATMEGNPLIIDKTAVCRLVREATDFADPFLEKKRKKVAGTEIYDKCGHRQLVWDRFLMSAGQFYGKEDVLKFKEQELCTLRSLTEIQADMSNTMDRYPLPTLTTTKKKVKEKMTICNLKSATAIRKIDRFVTMNIVKLFYPKEYQQEIGK